MATPCRTPLAALWSRAQIRLFNVQTKDEDVKSSITKWDPRDATRDVTRDLSREVIFLAKSRGFGRTTH
jgi:hypothetical protein